MYPVIYLIFLKNLFFSAPAVPPVAPGPGLQLGLRQHVHQDLVGPHPLHQEGREEGEEEGRRHVENRDY